MTEPTRWGRNVIVPAEDYARLQAEVDELRAGIQWARGMCTDGRPVEEIDHFLGCVLAGHAQIPEGEADQIQPGDYGCHGASGEWGTVREVRDDGKIVFGIGIFRDPLICEPAELDITSPWSPSREALEADVERLRAENERLRGILDGEDMDAIERVARAAFSQGLGFDIDADPTARESMLRYALYLLRAAGENARPETDEKEATDA